MTDPVPAPDIPHGIQWRELGVIIGRYDESLTSCNGKLAGIREIVNDNANEGDSP